MDDKPDTAARVVKLNRSAGSGSSTNASPLPARGSPLHKLPDWLWEWNAGDPPPATAPVILDLLDQVSLALAPMTEDEFLLAASPLSDLFGPPNPEMLERLYEIVKEIPAAAFAEAVRRCMRECREFPMPVDILERADQYHRMATARSRLKTALWRLDVEEKRRKSAGTSVG